MTSIANPSTFNPSSFDPSAVSPVAFNTPTEYSARPAEGSLAPLDYGTPASKSKTLVQVDIDGQIITVQEGTSLLRAATSSGIEIPRLCATDSLKPFGSCRLCLVEIEGARGTPASCTTPVRDGMKVTTHSDQLGRLRRNVMELYLSDHDLDRETAESRGSQLFEMADKVGVTEIRYLKGEGTATHAEGQDTSNPYFTYSPSECIVCSRCVRACSDIQGTFALTVEGRGFGSRIKPGNAVNFFESECVSCGACVQACPTSALVENRLLRFGVPDRQVRTTCAYCGVGCTFDAQLSGNQLVRMMPAKDGGANQGHSCVKGRFAFGYTNHKDRQLHPLRRDSINDKWQVTTWDKVLQEVAEKLLGLQGRYGPNSIGAITSSRTTNEDVYAVQKLVRGAFGNNNVDTCARVCHSPTGYGLSQTFGTSAGTQTFQSVDHCDVILVIGANPTDAHPVFGSRMKRRVREGAKLIVADPRRIDLVRSPHVEATIHLPIKPGTNVAFVNAMAYTIVEEDLVDRAFLAERCEGLEQYLEFIRRPQNSPEAMAEITGVAAKDIRMAARLYATGGNAAIYYGLGVTEHSQGSTMVMGLANLAMLTGNIGREGVGINPLRGQNNVQGSCDMGSFPHELPGYRHLENPDVRAVYEQQWGRLLDPAPGLRIPNMFDAAIGGSFKGLFVEGEDIAQSDPNITHVHAALRSLEVVVVQDLFLNETSKFAHYFLPGTSFLEKDGTFTNSERRINRVRPVYQPKHGMPEWRAVAELGKRMGFDMGWNSSSEIMDEIAATTPSFAGISFERLDREGSLQWPCNEGAPDGTAIMHVGSFNRGRGRLMKTTYVPTRERGTRNYPLMLTTGRILTQYNVGAQTRRTPNYRWHAEDRLEIHPSDAELRGIRDGDMVCITSRTGSTKLRALVADRMPEGVVYTTFHHPESFANVVTTEYSDWATNCPEYKVTAVQVEPVSASEGGNHSGSIPAQVKEPASGRTDHVVAGHARSEVRHEWEKPEVRMAEDIARRFADEPDTVAAATIVDHIRKFWHPTLIENLLRYVEEGQATLPAVILATEQIRAEPLPIEPS